MAELARRYRLIKELGVLRAGYKALASVTRRLGKRCSESADYFDGLVIRPGMPCAAVAENSSYNNLHRGKRCFIVGNGPSIKEQDLSLLTNELTFVMNGFWKHPLMKELRPKYYCFADEVFFDGSSQCAKFFADLRQIISRDTTLFVPLAAQGIITECQLLPADQVKYVSLYGRLRDGLPGRPDLTTILPGPMNVSQLAIMAAMAMGCSPIYLLGLDHDWLSHRGTDKHFYQGNILDNHKLATPELSNQSYKLLMECQLELWNGYEVVSNVAKQNDIQILNATFGGFLDVFPRVDYASLFSA